MRWICDCSTHDIIAADLGPTDTAIFYIPWHSTTPPTTTMASAPAGSELFENYAQDYTTISASIKQKVEQAIPSQSGEQRKATIRAVEREAEEADEIVGQMEIEILNLPQSTRTRLQPRLRNYKSELDKLKRDLKRASTQGPSAADREELLGQSGGVGASGDLDASTMDQRARLLTGTDRLAESSRRLQDSHRIALETESLGVNILGTLRDQREQIVTARNTLADADSYIDKASKTLKGMARR
ncbi:vesicle transport v-SNARE protein N-terminus-domain-containing protein [Jimgerdemannia flammicorona]|uniref:Vesicle transport v-SNARE protein N-terminus-domain-containing protein n=1 Tax=Jimgerdemannia flammicorona TaxID=994334 RepID=A0A433QDB2_9FUNG|nr:vesicle transport v-SNARE protein N-terminus-domain-containing protein [Jimgerdemannia flammicorona]